MNKIPSVASLRLPGLPICNACRFDSESVPISAEYANSRWVLPNLPCPSNPGQLIVTLLDKDGGSSPRVRGTQL
jgi:hypothetical protein